MIQWKKCFSSINFPSSTINILIILLPPLLVAAANSERFKFGSYEKIMQNKVRVQFKKRENSINECGCVLTDEFPCSRKNGCLNVFSSVECSELCPALFRCLNQNFRRGPQFSFQIRETESNGYGFYANDDIPPKRFIIEYMGEIITYEEFEKRFEKIEGENYYMFTINANRFIDAREMGNESRFINHSCEPNAEANKCIVYSNGEEHTRIGLFSLRQINKVNMIIMFVQFLIYRHSMLLNFPGRGNNF